MVSPQAPTRDARIPTQTWGPSTLLASLVYAALYNFSMSDKNKDKEEPRLIAANRRARHDYFIEETYEAGLALQGWEVKSLRDGRAQVAEAYVIIKNEEAWLIGAHFTPLSSASTHVHPDPSRTRKLLLHGSELSKLIGKVERAGYTLVPLDLHWTRGRAKLQIGLAKGKKKHDKREDTKQKDWKRQKERLMRHA
jgi:SsrA-binding protein